MTNPRLEDHVLGLELQLVEVVEQKQRAEVQGRTADVGGLERQVEALQTELATSAEVASVGRAPTEVPEAAHVHAPTASESSTSP